MPSPTDTGLIRFEDGAAVVTGAAMDAYRALSLKYGTRFTPPITCINLGVTASSLEWTLAKSDLVRFVQMARWAREEGAKTMVDTGVSSTTVPTVPAAGAQNLMPPTEVEARVAAAMKDIAALRQLAVVLKDGDAVKAVEVAEKPVDDLVTQVKALAPAAVSVWKEPSVWLAMLVPAFNLPVLLKTGHPLPLDLNGVLAFGAAAFHAIHVNGKKT